MVAKIRDKKGEVADFVILRKWDVVVIGHELPEVKIHSLLFVMTSV